LSKSSFAWPRRLRILAGVVVLALVSIAFMGRDFAWMPQWSALLSTFQIGPVVLRLMTHPITLSVLVIAALLAGLTLLYGRVYCSFLCPFGVAQDWLVAALRLFRLRKYDYRPLPKLRWLHYSVLFVVVAGLILGVAFPLLLLDPYAMTGRFLSLLLKPLATAGNNQLLAWVGEGRFGWLNPMSYAVPVWSAIALVVVMLILLVYVVRRWGRIYCNSVCPVGALLRLLSHFSLFKLAFVPEGCQNCRQCAKRCKAGCIDVDTKQLDFERCLLCFNCATSCKFGGLRWVRRGPIAEHLDLPLRRTSAPSAPAEAPKSNDRREFLAVAGTLTAGAVLLPPLWLDRHSVRESFPVMPPGAGSFDRLASRCVGCHLCVESCPSKVIRPAVMQYGVAGFMLPHLDFHANMCEFNCTACSHACPTGALLPLSRDQKHLAQIGKVRYMEKYCVVPQEKVDCGACAEHCPTGAVSMKPWKDGLTIPVVDVSICIGCGCCEHVCPVRPQRAIVVDGLRQQAVALPPPKNAPVKVKDDGFPF